MILGDSIIIIDLLLLYWLVLYHVQWFMDMK
jgi:hypothetical protein